MKKYILFVIVVYMIKICLSLCPNINYPYYKSKSVCNNNSSITVSKYYYPNENTLYSYYKNNPINKNDIINFVPEYKGSIIPNFSYNNTHWGYLNWTSSNCFRTNTGKLIVGSNTVNLTFTTNNSSSNLCGDWYFIVTQSSYHIKFAYIRGTHTLLINGISDFEKNDIIKNGLKIFYFSDGFIGTLIDAYQVYRIFFGTYVSNNSQKFLESNMGIKFIERPNKFYNISEKSIRDGDLIIKTVMDGPSALTMYGTGGRAAHVCVMLWINSELYVLEATFAGIIKTKYREWLSEMAHNNTYIMIAHLNDYYYKKFSAPTALNFFKSVENLSYGVSNIFYSWVDTVNNNYPTPLNENLLPSLLALTESLYPQLIYNIFIKGINQRLAYYFNLTECKNMMDVFKIINSKNITLSYLFSLPEKDTWTYSQGKQFVCSSFVMAVYKNAGLFDNISFQATEFTPKDVYQLNIFNGTWDVPKECRVQDYKYCQIVGNHYWELPQFNSIKPYDNMNEKCGALPPLYKRYPNDC